MGFFNLFKSGEAKKIETLEESMKLGVAKEIEKMRLQRLEREYKEAKESGNKEKIEEATKNLIEMYKQASETTKRIMKNDRELFDLEFNLD